MKLAISELTNERLDQEIAKIYWESHQVGFIPQGRAKHILNMLWGEFDQRAEEGRGDYESKPGYGVYGA